MVTVSPITGILLHGVMIPTLLNKSLASWFLMSLDFFLPQIVQFGTSINLFCSVFLSLKCFSYNWYNTFLLFLYSIFRSYFRTFDISFLLAANGAQNKLVKGTGTFINWPANLPNKVPRNPSYWINALLSLYLLTYCQQKHFLFLSFC